MRAGGGIWTLEDLKNYRVVERKPLVGEYHGARIVTASPPSSGGIAVLDSLNILAGFDLHDVDSATRKHLIIEAMRRAYRDRAIFLGDPDFIKMPLQQLMSVDYAAGQRSSIRADKAMPSDLLPGIESEPKGMNTTHFSVLDAAGNRAAVTITVNLFFGNGYMPAGTGVLLNNEMDDFSTKPGTTQRLRAHRQHGQLDRSQQAKFVQHVADVRRDAARADDHRLARRKHHHQPGAPGNLELCGRHERRGHRQVPALPSPIPA